MKQKKKPCKVCKEMKFIFSKGRCRYCSSLGYKKKAEERAAEKAKKKLEEIDQEAEQAVQQIKKKQKIRKQKPILVTEKHKEEKRREREAMFKTWNFKEDLFGFCYCQECNKNLGSTFNPYNLAHIISKGANSSLRADPRNFLILCAEHHNQFDSEARSEMKVFKLSEQIRQELKAEDSKKF